MRFAPADAALPHSAAIEVAAPSPRLQGWIAVGVHRCAHSPRARGCWPVALECIGMHASRIYGDARLAASWTFAPLRLPGWLVCVCSAVRDSFAAVLVGCSLLPLVAGANVQRRAHSASRDAVPAVFPISSAHPAAGACGAVSPFPLVFHPAAPDPRIHETGYRVGAWRWPRGRFLYGAESPFFSLTRSPASTPYCETGSSGERAV